MESIIRKTIRSILQETRANLPIRPVMKVWWQVAGQYGENATRELERKLLAHQWGVSKSNFAVGLRVPKEHQDKVFDQLTSETQEWVLKHWGTKEYFGNMISGVILGVVEWYGDDSTAIGQQYGRTEIEEGTWNAQDKTWVGGMSGYLTIKSDRDSRIITRLGQLWQNPAQKTSVRTDVWNRYGLRDIRTQDSVLFHEFQHWFQTSVMYVDKRMTRPTKASKGGTYTRPKGRAPEKYDPPSGYIMKALEQFVQGVNWSNPTPHPNARCEMYQITDIEKLKNTLYNAGYGYKEVWPMSQWTQPENFDKDAIIDYIENTLKMPLSEEGKEMIHPATFRQLTSYGWQGDDRETVGNYKSGKRPTIEAQDEAFARLNAGVQIRIVLNTAYKKKKGVYTNVMKPNQFPVKPTSDNLDSARHIVFIKHKGYGVYDDFIESSHTGGRGSSFFQKARAPMIGGAQEWGEYWHEFDAESRNYLAMMTMEMLKEHASFQKQALLSNEQELSDALYRNVLMHLNRNERISRKIMLRGNIKKEINNMTDRVADRIVEVVEEFDPYWFKENTPGDYAPIAVDIQRVKTDFIDGEGYWRHHMWGGYWEFIHDKVIGEV